MEMSRPYIDLYSLIPIQKVADGCIISKRADVTFGWELEMPELYSLTEQGYDSLVDAFHQACKILPPWTMVHRQDVFTYETYRPQVPLWKLDEWYGSRFAGRRYLVNRQYLWLTFSSRLSSLRPNSQTAAFAPRFRSPVPTEREVREWEAKAGEFAAVLESTGKIKARRLTTEEIEGDDTREGLIDRYLFMSGSQRLSGDMVMTPESVEVLGRKVVGYRIAESEELPGEVSDVLTADKFGMDSGLYYSYGSALGMQLGCDHVVNQYILVPEQQKVLQELDSKKRRMISMSKNSANRLGSEQIQSFQDAVYNDALSLCYTHFNVLAWCQPGEEADVRGKIVTALTKTMGCVAVEAASDLPSLFFAGCPGGGCESGKDNLLVSELRCALCMGIYDTFQRPLDGGQFLLCDRERNVPVAVDFQMAARRAHLIDNYNVFLLGPSGAGKSFFTNLFLSQCYCNGEQDVVIDIGGSYEGLCRLVNELSGGKDGHYLSWDENHKITFNPFMEFDSWLDEGILQQDEGGASFFLSVIKTIWEPKGGWQAQQLSILVAIVTDFVKHMYDTKGRDYRPIFDDFYRYLGEVIQPRIIPVLDKKGNVVSLPENPYVVAYNPVTPEQFDIVLFLRSLVTYSLGGMYGFLLNDRNPADLFTSRFTVFEVKKLSEGDETFYSLCILCITGAFDAKMRSEGGFKRLVIDEAWKALMNKTMEPYLKSLWKTARKYSTSAMVVTQELDDIVSSSVIKDTILANSDIKILLNQEKNRERFGQLQSLLGLTEHQKSVILSMMKGHPTKYGYYTDVYIGYLNRYNVMSVEASPQQVLAYESEYEDKRPVLELADELGSIASAIEAKTDYKPIDESFYAA